MATNAAARHDKRDELRLLVNSRYPIIAIETYEESRVEELLTEVALELAVPLYVWSVTTGLVRKGAQQPIYQTDQPEMALANMAQIRGDALFLLKDFARYLEQDRILRRTRELAQNFREARRSIILSGPTLKLPAELDDQVAPFRPPRGPGRSGRAQGRTLEEGSWGAMWKGAGDLR